ncbi:MAG TPA: HPr(Ser) kinase/phosphatase [Thermoanaerobaculia bacterium]|jgi:HPr kinase/phosphorylase|nr:HPr(Ser) kinase/phosphatase [Thermoanaerobaculia bacterium]
MRESEGKTLTTDALRAPSLSVLALSLVAGEPGLGRPLTGWRIQRPGLAIAGFLPYIKPGRIQILGESELDYIQTLSPLQRRQRFAAIATLPVAGFVVTKGLAPPPELLRECRRRSVPLFLSPATTSLVIQRITGMLEDSLAPQQTVHGVLVDVHGMGVLLTGESGIGKSECALDLITRGHRLVADDAVQISRLPSGRLVARASNLIRYHMELRGIGIINIKHLFGVSAVRASQDVDLVIALERWKPGEQYDRLGLSQETYEILGEKRPLMRLPVASGRNLAILIEIAARNELLKSQGYDAAREFTERVDAEIARNARAPKKRARH